MNVNSPKNSAVFILSRQSLFFLLRVHHLNMAQIGLIVGSVMGASGIVGGLIGGIVTNKVGKGRDAWKTLVPGIMLILAAPALLLQYLPGSVAISLTFLFIVQILLPPANGLELALVQTVVKVRLRAFAASLFFVFANLFGMALAPLVVGMMNDSLTGRFGTMAVRYSMLVAVPVSVLGGLFLIWAAKYINGDIALALERDAKAAS